MLVPYTVAPGSLYWSNTLHGLDGVADVKALQTALKSYATATGNVAADPGAIDGVVGKRTIAALAAVISKIPSSKIPAQVKTVLQYAAPVIASGIIPDSYIADIGGVIAQHAAVLAIGVALIPKTPGGGGGGGVMTYPTGAIQRFNIYHKEWRVYAPVGGLSGCIGCGLGDVMTLSAYDFTLLGGDIPTDPPPGMQLVAKTPTPAAGVPQSGTEDEKLYKKTWFWAAVGGTLVAGGGLYWALK
jgi:hypothetical protein